MSSVGEMLKKARLKKQLSIGDIVKLTNIRSFYIKAMESDHFSELPQGEAYHKAFLANYAQSVDLNKDEVINLYNHFINQQIFIEEGLSSTEVRSDNDSHLTFKLLLKLGIALLVIGAIALAIFLEQKQTQQPLDVTSPAPAKVKKETSDSLVEPKQLTKTEPPPLAPASGEQAEQPALNLNEADLVLKAVVLEDTVIELQIDQDRANQITLKKGEIKEWPARKQFVLSLSDASAVKLSLNDSEPRILGQSGQHLSNIVFMKEQGSN